MSTKFSYEELEKRVRELERADIERAQAEEALHIALEEHEKIFKAAPVWVVLSSLKDGRYLKVNEAFSKTLGYEMEEVIGQTSLDLKTWVNPADRERIVTQLKEKGSVRNAAVQRKTRSGEIIDTLSSSEILDLEGETVMISITQDITGLKRAEADLKDSQRRLSTLMDNLPGMAYRCQNDPDWTMEFVSNGCLNLTGYKPEELIGNSKVSYGDIIHPEDRQMVWDVVSEALKFRKPFQITYRIITAGGELKWAWEQGQGILGEDGNIEALEGFITDITKHRQAEEALQASELRFRELFNNMSSGVAIYDSPDDGQSFIFKDLNRAGLEYGHKIKENVIGRDVREVFPGIEDLGLFDVFKRVWKTGKPEHHPSSVYKDSDLVLWVENYICKLPTGELVAIYEDTTARKQAEGAKEELERQLQQAQKMEAIGTLAGGIAHDFNNILTPFMVNTEIAMMDLPEGHPVQDNLKEALKAGYRARDLVKQILAFSRQQENIVKPIKVNTIVEEALKLLRASIPTTIDIQSKLEAKSDTVLADATQIHQLIINLCTNAAHAMSEAGGELIVKTMNQVIQEQDLYEASEMVPGEYLKLEVSDSGYGMDQAVLRRIFEPYYTTKGKQHGTGLGLAMVHGIVKALRGEITAYSEPGIGSVFNVYLPIAPETDRNGTEQESASKLPRGSERILLVDDEKTLVETVQPMLERLGYRVTGRTNSIEALETFKTNPNAFDLVITDQTMPYMTGKGLANEMFSIREDIPIILCTGFSEQIDEQQAKAMGISAFVVKPILMNEIAATIRNVLDAEKSGGP